MTPCIEIARRAKIRYAIHEYEHNSGSESYGKEAAQKLDVDENRVFKTLIAKLADRSLIVAIIPVSSQLSMKNLAKAAGAKKASMANTTEVERSSGYVLGGVSPLGQKKSLKTWIDDAAQTHSTLFVSAGRRGLEIELSPQDLKRLSQAQFAPLVANDDL